MIKNSASNLPITQALHTQAAQILPTLSALFTTELYSEIVHQRISQHSHDSGICYRGLSRATHQRVTQVMIKWQLSSTPQPYPADLSHEIRVLKTLQPVSRPHNAIIAPPLLHSDSMTIPQQPSPLYQARYLTFFAIPYYANGSVAYYQKQSLNDQQKHQLIMQAAQLLAHLHHEGWIHGDVKPSNFLIDIDSTDGCSDKDKGIKLLLTDFALATQSHKTPLCRTTHSAGTPAYLAPECWQGQGASVQSDLYAFGIMMYEIVMGRRPFAINRQSQQPLTDWAIQHCQQPVTALRYQYRPYQKIMDKALAKRIGHRYQSMQEILEDLQTL